ncbi:MAG: signal transduction histidine kinase/CheY-like chemotaxis protein, partial [Planctomycetota bacterium]
DEAGKFGLFAEDLPTLSGGEFTPISITIDEEFGVLFGNPRALYYVDKTDRRAIALTNRSGFEFFGVQSLMRDREGHFWGATATGAFKLLGLGIRTLRITSGLLADDVTAILERRDGSFVLGHYGGVIVLRAGVTTQVSFEGFDENSPSVGRVMDLAEDRAGNVWIAASALGVGRLDREGEFTWWGGGLAHNDWANAVREVEEGEILVGTNRGLWRIKDDHLEPLGEGASDPVGNVHIRSLNVGPGGVVTLVSNTGLWRRQGGVWSEIPSPKGIRRSFYSIMRDQSGRVWCGGSDGLFLLRDGELVIPEPAYRVQRPVYSMTEDTRGRLWLGTDYGFLRADGQEILNLDWLADFTGHDSNRAAALTDHEGRVWMGTNRGVTVIEEAFNLSTDPPSVEFLGLDVGSSSRSLEEPVRIATGRSDLLFRARALSFRDESQMEFRSRVVGFTDWETRTGSTVLEARFTGLPPGSFQFEVQARGPGGHYGETLRSPMITVVGPIWKRWWFLTLVGCLSAGLTALIVNQVHQQVQARRLHLEVARRTQELEISLTELAKTDRLRSLGFLAGGIAHDLRNVLAVLTGNFSLLRNQLGSKAELNEFLDPVDGALRRATQLSSQLQTFSTGGEPVKRAVSTADVVNTCASLVLSGSRVTRTVDMEKGLWPANAEEAQVRQVVENLLMNARQCQPDGGWVRISGMSLEIGPGEEASGRSSLPPGRYVQIVIADGGPGISDELQRHIFDPFYSTKAGGSGLGLSTAFSVAQRHGGALEVDSREGQGATFTLILPAAESEVEQDYVMTPTQGGGGEGRVLVVDDDSGIRRLLLAMLSRLGYVADSAADSNEARDLVAHAQESGQPFQYAILDHTLPGDLTGPEILRELRKIEPDLQAVASSGYSAEAVLSHFESHGFQGALPKPYSMADLARVMGCLDREKRSVSEFTTNAQSESDR